MERKTGYFVHCITGTHPKELYFMGVVCATETRSKSLSPSLCPHLSFYNKYALLEFTIQNSPPSSTNWAKKKFLREKEVGEKNTTTSNNPFWVPEMSVNNERKVPGISSGWSSRGKEILFHRIHSSKRWITNLFMVAFQIGELDPYWKTNESWLHSSAQIPALPQPSGILFSFFMLRSMEWKRTYAFTPLYESSCWYAVMTNSLQSRDSIQRVEKNHNPGLQPQVINNIIIVKLTCQIFGA